MSTSRRELLAATAAATITLPMLQAALNANRAASAADEKAPTGPITTKLKPADLKDKEFTAVGDHPVLLVRNDKTITALSNKCTHKGCSLKPQPGKDSITCKCHAANFTLEGTPTKVAKDPLPNFAIKLAPDGTIEIDPSQKVTKTDANFALNTN